jgi:S-adenosylmethionine:tRNA ribosyltransferase-isomerase
MHAEWGEITAATADTINTAKERSGRIIAIGTTALRLLETTATDDGIVRPFSGDTDIFITPGYKFKVVDALLTNFHLPCSTLFMLVSAFSGLATMKAAYAHAITAGYRFYSYGDACWLKRADVS